MYRTGARLAGSKAGRSLVPLLVVAVTSCCGLSLGLLRHAYDGNLGLTASPASLDFGEVWEQDDFQWNLVLQNPGVRTISVASFEATCHCTLLSAHGLSIAPKTSITVPMHIDLSPRDASQRSSRSYSFAVHVIPKFRENDKELVGRGWSLHGRVRRVFALSEHRVALGIRPRFVRGAPMPAHRLRAKPFHPLHSIRAWSEPDVISADVHRDPSGDFVIDIMPRSDLTCGSFHSKLWVQGYTDQNAPLPPVSAPVDTVISQRVIAIPGTVDFGRRSTNDVAESVVRLESTLDEPFVVSGITVHDTDAEPLTIALRRGAGDWLQVRKRLGHSGGFSAEATITIRLQNGDCFDVPLPVRAYVTDVPLQGG